MKIGDRVQFKGRTGKIVAFMPGEMVDVQFEDVGHVERRAKSLLALTAKNNPGRVARQNAGISKEEFLEVFRLFTLQPIDGRQEETVSLDGKKYDFSEFFALFDKPIYGDRRMNAAVSVKEMGVGAGKSTGKAAGEGIAIGEAAAQKLFDSLKTELPSAAQQKIWSSNIFKYAELSKKQQRNLFRIAWETVYNRARQRIVPITEYQVNADSEFELIVDAEKPTLVQTEQSGRLAVENVKTKIVYHTVLELIRRLRARAGTYPATDYGDGLSIALANQALGLPKTESHPTREIRLAGPLKNRLWVGLPSKLLAAINAADIPVFAFPSLENLDDSVFIDAALIFFDKSNPSDILGTYLAAAENEDKSALSSVRKDFAEDLLALHPNLSDKDIDQLLVAVEALLKNYKVYSLELPIVAADKNAKSSKGSTEDLIKVLEVASQATSRNFLSVYYNTWFVSEGAHGPLDAWAALCLEAQIPSKFDWAGLCGFVVNQIKSGVSYDKINKELGSDVNRRAFDLIKRKSGQLIAGYEVRDSYLAPEGTKQKIEVEKDLTVTFDATADFTVPGEDEGTRKRRKDVKEKKTRPSYFKPKQTVSREPRSAMDEILRRTKVSWFTRHDPLRPASDIKTCGNPIDGTAYYLVVDAERKTYSRYLTWEDTKKNVRQGTRATVEVMYPGALDVLRRLKVPVVYEEIPGEKVTYDDWLKSRWPEEVLNYGKLINRDAPSYEWKPVSTKQVITSSNYVTLTEAGRLALQQGFVVQYESESENLLLFMSPLRSSGMNAEEFKQFHIRRGKDWFDTLNRIAQMYDLIEVKDLGSDPILAISESGAEAIQSGALSSDLATLLAEIPKAGIQKHELLSKLQKDESLNLDIDQVPSLLEEAKVRELIIETLTSEIEKITRTVQGRSKTRATKEGTTEIRWASGLPVGEKTSPEDYYRHFYNSHPKEFERLFRLYTEVGRQKTKERGEQLLQRILALPEEEQRKFLARSATKRRFGPEEAQRAADLFKTQKYTPVIPPKPGDIVEARISRLQLKDRQQALQQMSFFAVGEFEVRQLQEEVQDFYHLKNISSSWGNQKDTDEGISASTLDKLARYNTERTLVQKFYAASSKLEKEIAGCVQTTTINTVKNTYWEAYAQPVGKTPEGVETVLAWNPRCTEKLRPFLSELHQLYATAVDLDERLSAPFTAAEAGDIFAPLRRIFGVLQFAGLFGDNLKDFEADIQLKEDFRQNERKQKSPRTKRIPRLSQGIDQDRLDKLLDYCFVEGEQKAYPITQVTVTQDPNRKGKAIDADPARDFYVMDGEKKVFFKIERRLYPGYSFVNSLNPYTYRQFRAIRDDDDVVQLLVDSAHEAGTDISRDLAELYLAAGMISVNPNLKGASEDYAPVEYITEPWYRIRKNQTIRIYNRYKAYSPYYSWQQVDGPEAIIDTSRPTAQATVPCIDPVDAQVMRTMGYFRSILYGMQEVFSTIRSIFRNATQGQGGASTGSELQLDTVVRKFLRTVEFYNSVVTRLRSDIEESADFPIEKLTDREKAARKALNIIENTVKEYNLTELFALAGRTDLYSSGRGVAKPKTDEQRIRGYQRRREYKPRTADIASSQNQDVEDESRIVPLQEALLRKVTEGFSQIFPKSSGANIIFPSPRNSLKVPNCDRGASLPAMKPTDEWPTFAQTTLDFLLGTMLKAANIDRSDTTNPQLEVLQALTYNMISDMFTEEGERKRIRNPMYGVLPFIYPSFSRTALAETLKDKGVYKEQVSQSAQTLLELANKGLTVPVLRPGQAVFLRVRDTELNDVLDLATRLKALNYTLYADFAPSIEAEELRRSREPRAFQEIVGRRVNATELAKLGIATQPRSIRAISSDLVAGKIDFIVDTDPIRNRSFWDSSYARDLLIDAAVELHSTRYPKLVDAISNNGYVAATLFKQAVQKGSPVNIASEDVPSQSDVWDFRTGKRIAGVTPEIDPLVDQFVVRAANFAEYYDGGIMYSAIGPNGQLFGDLKKALTPRELEALRNRLLGDGQNFEAGDILLITYTPVNPKLFASTNVISTIEDLKRMIYVLGSQEVQVVDKAVPDLTRELVRKMEDKLWRKKVQRDPDLYAFWSTVETLNKSGQLSDLVRFLVLAQKDKEEDAFILQMRSQLSPKILERLNNEIKAFRYTERAQSTVQKRINENIDVLDQIYRYMGSQVLNEKYGLGLIESQNKEVQAQAADLLNFFGRIASAKTQEDINAVDVFKLSKMAKTRLEALQKGMVWRPVSKEIRAAVTAEEVLAAKERFEGRRPARARVPAPVPVAERGLMGASYPLPAEQEDRPEMTRRQSGQGTGECVLTPITDLQKYAGDPREIISYPHALDYRFQFITPKVWYLPYDTTDVLGTYEAKLADADEVLAQTNLAMLRQLDENQALFAILTSAVNEFNSVPVTRQMDVAYKWFRIFTLSEMFYYFTGYTSFGSLLEPEPESKEEKGVIAGKVKVGESDYLTWKLEDEIAAEDDEIHKVKQRFDKENKNIKRAILSINRWTNRTYLGPKIGQQLDWLAQTTIRYQKWKVEELVNRLGEDYRKDVMDIKVTKKNLIDYLHNVQGDTRSEEELSNLISTLEQAQQMSEGAQGLRKSGNVAVFKTYNPILFELTRDNYGGILTGKTELLMDTDAVVALDMTGVYGTLLQTASETALMLNQGLFQNPDSLLRYRLGLRKAGEGEYETDVWWFSEERRFLDCFLRGRHFEPRVKSDPFSGMAGMARFFKKADFDDVKYVGQLWPLEIPLSGVKEFFLRGNGQFKGFFNLDESKPNILSAVSTFRKIYERYVAEIIEGPKTRDTGLSSYDPYKVLSGTPLILDIRKPKEAVLSTDSAKAKLEKKYRAHFSSALSSIYSNLLIGNKEEQHKKEIQLIRRWNADLLKKQADSISNTKYIVNVSAISFGPGASKQVQEQYVRGIKERYVAEAKEELSSLIRLYGKLASFDASDDAQIEEMVKSSLMKVVSRIEFLTTYTNPRKGSLTSSAGSSARQAYFDKIELAMSRSKAHYDGYEYFTHPEIIERLLESVIKTRSTAGVDRRMPSFYKATHSRKEGAPVDPLAEDETQLWEGSTWSHYRKQPEVQNEEKDLVLRAKSYIADKVDDETKNEAEELLLRRRQQAETIRSEIFDTEQYRQAYKAAYEKSKVADDFDVTYDPDDLDDTPSSLRDNPRSKYRRVMRSVRPARKTRKPRHKR